MCQSCCVSGHTEQTVIAIFYDLQLDGSGLWPTSSATPAAIPPCSLVTVCVIRKPGTALGMSVAGGRGSVPFVGNDEVNSSSGSADSITCD